MDNILLNWSIVIVLLMVFFIWWIKPYCVQKIQKLTKTYLHKKRNEHEPDISQPAKMQHTQAKNIFTLHIESPENHEFEGETVVNQLEDAHLILGDQDMYQFFVNQHGIDQLVFNVINGIEPGYLNADFRETTTPCITFWFIAEQSYDALKSLHQMLNVADEIATALGGIVCDADHNPLTDQARRYMISSVQRLHIQSKTG